MIKPPDSVDAWLDEVRRWYFGGTPPAGDLPDLPDPPNAPAPQADVRRRRQPGSEPTSTRMKTVNAARPSAAKRS